MSADDAQPKKARCRSSSTWAELRTRIVWSLIPAADRPRIVAFRFSDHIIKFIARPLAATARSWSSLAPTEALLDEHEGGHGRAALFLAMPVILWQVWAFVAPGLHKHERKYAGPFVIIGSLLFLAGGAFALLVVVPFAITFLVTFGQDQGLQADDLGRRATWTSSSSSRWPSGSCSSCRW